MSAWLWTCAKLPDARWHRTEPVGQRVDVVYPQLHDRAAGIALAVRSPCLRLEGARQRHVRLGQDHPPERAVVEQLLDAARRAEPAERMADHQRHAGVRALARRIRSPAAVLSEIGFSTKTWRPRSAHASACSSCTSLGVASSTPSTQGRAIASLEVRGGLAAEVLGELAPLLFSSLLKHVDELEPGALRSVGEARRPHARADDRDASHPSWLAKPVRRHRPCLVRDVRATVVPILMQQERPRSAPPSPPRSVCSQGMRRSSLPVIARYGCRMRSATPLQIELGRLRPALVLVLRERLRHERRPGLRRGPFPDVAEPVRGRSPPPRLHTRLERHHPRRVVAAEAHPHYAARSRSMSSPPGHGIEHRVTATS